MSSQNYFKGFISPSPHFLILHDFYPPSYGGHDKFSCLLHDFLLNHRLPSRTTLREFGVARSFNPVFLFNCVSSFCSELVFIFKSRELTVILNSVFSLESILLFLFATLLRKNTHVVPPGMFNLSHISLSGASLKYRFLISVRFIYASLLLRFCDSIIVTSDLEGRLIKDSFVHTAPLSTLLPSALYFPSCSSGEISEGFPKISYCPDVFTVISAGRICQSKGSILLLRVFHTLHKLYPSRFRFLVLGPVSKDSNFFHSAASGSFFSGALQLFPHVYNKNDFFHFSSVADVFLTCSPSESFGMTIYESLAYGLPVVCSQYPGHIANIN